jgi:cob(I)alamin adenosyltransferase
MRWLVVYDGVNELKAVQNLQVALQQANNFLTAKIRPTENTGSKEVLELEICILQLLLEEFPLDDYISDMERATAEDLAQVNRVLQEYPYDREQITVAVKVLRGQEKEASSLVAAEAKSRKAERIYLPLEESCWKCQNSRVSRSNPLKTLFTAASWWRRRASKSGQTPPAEIRPSQVGIISVAELLGQAPCPVYPTCHNEVVFSLQMQRSTSWVGGDKPGQNFKAYD